MKKIFIILVLGLVATGCAQKKVTKPEPDQHIIKPSEEEALKPPPEVEQITEQLTEQLTEQVFAKVESVELPEKYEVQEEFTFNDIYFDYDRYEIKNDAVPTLKELSSWLINSPSKILIEGHCDERGTNEYNLALGDRRVVATKNYLSASGVPSEKIDTISYGEEKPQCTEHNEACWSVNRRAHFVIVEAGK